MKKVMALSLVLLLVLTYLTSLNQSYTSEKSPELSFAEITIPLILEKSKEVSEFYYLAETKHNQQDLQMSFQQQVWIRGDRVRFEITFFSESGSPIETHGLIYQEKDEKHVQYRIDNQKTNTTSAMTFSLFTGTSESFLNATMNLDPDKSTIIGWERVSNRLCVIVQNPDNKVWIDARDFVPLRIDRKSVV